MVNHTLKDFFFLVFIGKFQVNRKGKREKPRTSLLLVNWYQRESEKNKQKKKKIKVNKVLVVQSKGKESMFWLPPGIAAEKTVYKTPFTFLA